MTILVELRAPDGRLPRIKAESIDEVKAQLQPGYEIIGRVFGVDGASNGGFVARQGEPSLMAQLLEAHGDELLAWLGSHQH
jgi:hypothetical protein